jgi:hypothetical protein
MIRLEPWSDFAERELRRVAGLDLPDIRREVLAGVSQLWHCNNVDGRGCYGYVVTRLERRGDGLEWVWLACAGKGFGAVVELFLQAAKAADLPIRVYINRKGMQRMYERLGFEVSETIMRKRWQ